ncbi:hypothetical protein OS493_029102 [Desmophyllum pertusum]|uniref:Multidrug resistance-associated protein 4 n=1 Tax=Desmophyllum pertusum TaxID=174260 RepID=A0A9W9Y8Y5_9CNID|nr:hypothetical protein OS493_029102 [Desmophyllum pertusum]
MARKAAKLREKAAAFTDERLVVMNEIISGIRAVKMYAWEWNFRDVVCDIRRKEMAIFRLKGVIVSVLVVLYFTTLPIAVLISVTTLAFTGTQLSSFTIFTVLLGLMTIRFAFCYNLSMSLQMVADAKVALDRIQAFLEEKVSKFEGIEHNSNQLSTEQVNREDNYNTLVQCKDKKKTMAVQLTNYRKRDDDDTDENSKTFTSNSTATGTSIILSVDQVALIASTQTNGPSLQSVKEPYLSISDASCSWNQDFLTNTLSDITLNASNGDMLVITGAVGSGKSSLLTAILGELPLCKGEISYHGKVAYVPQIPWVFSGTIRENILFSLPFNEEKFKHVVDICGLTKDLTDFTNGDLTEIGQRGATLSGGQKARVGLARAVYSDADIYLLDDPLSAVDTKVGRQLFESCIVGHLSGRIRLLVTHQLQHLKDLDHIAVMENGSINHQGGYKELTDQGVYLDILELPDLQEDDILSAPRAGNVSPNRSRSGSLYEFNEKEIINLHRPLFPSVSVLNGHGQEGTDNPAFLDNFELSELQENGCGDVSNCNDDSTPQTACTSVSEADQQPVLDMKEEEESKMTGTVTWRLYWDYFKEGLSVPMIVLLAVLLISAQGKTLLTIAKT